ncbi:transposase [Burkholderia sp. PAMC 26561]|uniref:transposase n=1 Tax=Burkholderiaceae TaxID=119060 RepID=UPI002119C331|nr:MULTISPECIES: transposase [Burkholderiaceae]
MAEVPCIGRLTATALVAKFGDAKTFRSGRDFAAFLGLLPRQSSTGGTRPRQSKIISKPGL